MSAVNIYVVARKNESNEALIKRDELSVDDTTGRLFKVVEVK